MTFVGALFSPSFAVQWNDLSGFWGVYAYTLAHETHVHDLIEAIVLPFKLFHFVRAIRCFRLNWFGSLLFSSLFSFLRFNFGLHFFFAALRHCLELDPKDVCHNILQLSILMTYVSSKAVYVSVFNLNAPLVSIQFMLMPSSVEWLTPSI